MFGTIATVLLLLLLSYLGSFGLYFGGQWLLREEPSVNLFGAMVPWLPWLLIVELPVLGFLGLASARKMKAERAHALTKPQALACMATLTTLTVGGIWNVSRFFSRAWPTEPTPTDVVIFVAVYGLSIAAMVLTLTITPDAGSYIKGARTRLQGGAETARAVGRRRRQPHRALRPLRDPGRRRHRDRHHHRPARAARPGPASPVRRRPSPDRRAGPDQRRRLGRLAPADDLPAARRRRPHRGLHRPGASSSSRSERGPPE